MKNKIIFTLALTTLLGIGYTNAQNNNAHKNKGENKEVKNTKNLTPEQKAQKSSDRLEKSLALTVNQKTKVYNFALTRVQKINELKSTETTDKKSKGDAFKAIKDEYTANVNSVLTPDQKAKWEQQKADAKAHRQDHKNVAGQQSNPTGDNDADEDPETAD